MLKTDHSVLEIKAITPSKFYKKDAITNYEIIFQKKAKLYVDEYRRYPHQLFGPTDFWKQFRTQAEALSIANKCSNASDTLCTFVYQNESGYREFIVAHPEVYWWYNMKIPAEARCSYEVIPEYSPCWLYFDLEFPIYLNPESNGPRMTATLIKIFCSYFLKYWGLPCDDKNVVNLDSTTNTKFSRHLIFCFKDIAFHNNLHAGRFVKGVCKEIEEYLANSTVFHDTLSFFELKDLQELFVETGKTKKIFVDTAVYSRNRHFRIYQSTKWGKNSYLKVAPESTHLPLEKRDDKELAIFLDSLISYFPNKKDLVLLEMDEDEAVHVKNYVNCPSQKFHNYANKSNSKYPALDQFVLSLVKPGKIRVCKEFEGYKKIVYEIIGNRFCANINRQHKSNNIFWIADLAKKIVYQKCHDEDCANFVSTPIPIPDEVRFQMDDEFDDLILNMPNPEADQSENQSR